MFKKILVAVLTAFFVLVVTPKTTSYIHAQVQTNETGQQELSILKTILKLLFGLFGGGIDQTVPPPSQDNQTPTSSFLPPPSSPSQNSGKTASDIAKLLSAHPNNLSVYQQAEAATGVAWQALAGIHFREGGMNPNQSLVGGRKIGQVEPDVPKSECSGGRSGPGIPYPASGGCAFRSLLDTAIYAGNHLKKKVSGDLSSSTQYTIALTRYNGGGNRNCGRGVPYQGPCPPPAGTDDPYVMNHYDSPHDNMYIIYCRDHVKCNPPKKDGRPGVLTVAKTITTAQ